MSTPTTPAEMADWLEEYGGPPSAAHPNAESLSDDWAYIVQWLRRQPTDAQKIEALMLASDAGVLGHDAWLSKQSQWVNSYVPASLSELACRDARKALRLLGLPTERE